MLIQGAEVKGGLCDVRLYGGLIAEIAPPLSLICGDDEPVIKAGGNALIPGLHDHHIHLQASAAAMASVKCGPPEVQNREQLAAALHAAPGDGWLRGIGYHASIGEVDRHWLDAHGPDRPIRIQHRGGRMWAFNSQAMTLLDLDIAPNGQLIDGDADLRAALGGQRPDLAPLVRRLLTRGITGVTDTTPGNDPEDFAFLASHCAPLRLVAMGKMELGSAPNMANATIGALKLHYHDYDLPPLDQLTREIAAAHQQGRSAAIHCVTRAEIMLALAAFEQAGTLSGAHTGDRIEHGAIADADITAWIARLGLTVVTQPHFVTERAAAYVDEVEPHELPHLWPLKRFADAGIKLAGGSDAPFGGIDPWAAMASAVKRPQMLSPEEAVTPEQALALYSKPADDAGAEPRIIAVGKPADLCLIDRNWNNARRDLASVEVTASWIGGELSYQTISSTSP